MLVIRSCVVCGAVPNIKVKVISLIICSLMAGNIQLSSTPKLHTLMYLFFITELVTTSLVKYVQHENNNNILTMVKLATSI